MAYILAVIILGVIVFYAFRGKTKGPGTGHSGGVPGDVDNQSGRSESGWGGDGGGGSGGGGDGGGGGS